MKSARLLVCLYLACAEMIDRWFGLASQQNLADAHYNLALCYFEGLSLYKL